MFTNWLNLHVWFVYRSAGAGIINRQVSQPARLGDPQKKNDLVKAIHTCSSARRCVCRCVSFGVIVRKIVRDFSNIDRSNYLKLPRPHMVVLTGSLPASTNKFKYRKFAGWSHFLASHGKLGQRIIGLVQITTDYGNFRLLTVSSDF